MSKQDDEYAISTAGGSVVLVNLSKFLYEAAPRKSKHKSIDVDMPPAGTPEDYLVWAQECMAKVPEEYRSVAVIEIESDYDGASASVSWKEK